VTQGDAAVAVEFFELCLRFQNITAHLHFYFSKKNKIFYRNYYDLFILQLHSLLGEA